VGVLSGQTAQPYLSQTRGIRLILFLLTYLPPLNGTTASERS